MIDNLQQLTPDVARASNVVARCHDRLAARRRRTEARSHAPTGRAVTTEQWVTAGFCAIYLLAMAGDLIAVAAMR